MFTVPKVRTTCISCGKELFIHGTPNQSVEDHTLTPRLSCLTMAYSIRILIFVYIIFLFIIMRLSLPTLIYRWYKWYYSMRVSETSNRKSPLTKSMNRPDTSFRFFMAIVSIALLYITIIDTMFVQDLYWLSQINRAARLTKENHRHLVDSYLSHTWRWPTVLVISNRCLESKTNDTATNITSVQLIVTCLSSVRQAWHLIIASKTVAYKPPLIAPNVL